MIDIIISMIDEDIKQLKYTLNSINYTNESIIVVVPTQVYLEYDLEKEFQSLSQKIIFLKNNNIQNNHMSNFYQGLHSTFVTKEIITFLKAGDYFLGAPYLTQIENVFNLNPNLLVLCGQIQSKNNISLYCNNMINLQGKFFKRQFIDYYTFLENFTNDIEFSLNLHYISETKSNILTYIDVPMVYINTPLSNIGEACHDYFDNIVPYQDFFDNTLTIQYIYKLITECYFSYVEAINSNIEETELNILLEDIYTYYIYFRQLELTDTDELIKIYNQGILIRYGIAQHPFTKNIPDIHLIQFLEQLEENIKKHIIKE